jgi:hypothetical protein
MRTKKRNTVWDGQTMIFIPTLNRVNQQYTYEWFSKAYIAKRNITIVCPKSESMAHLKLGRQVLECDYKGIGPTRQYIMDYASENGILKVIMCDDDHIHWYNRIADDSYHLRNATKPEAEAIFERIFDKLDEYALVGVSARSGNNRFFPATELEAIRQNNIHGIRVDVYKTEGLRFDRVPLMEDFDVILSLLERGYPNLLLTDVAWGQLASNAAGGCSTYRNNELQTKAAHALAELHPGLVRIHTKKAVSWGGGMNERDDVIIYWKKALESYGRK